MTVAVSADLPISDSTFRANIRSFETELLDQDAVSLHHKFSIDPRQANPAGIPIYHAPPWMIYQHDFGFVYILYVERDNAPAPVLIATFSHDHTQGVIAHRSPRNFVAGDYHSLTFFPTDQILLSRVLAERQGCIFHSAGMIIENQGLLFAGHSEAGKSTMMTLLKSSGQILCDDRNIARRHAQGWRLYGTWSHGDIPDVSPDSAPLRAIIFLEQAAETRLIPVDDRREILHRLPFLIIKPLVTADWWHKTLDLVGQMAREVPVYRLRFEKTERVIDALRPLLG